MVFSNRKEVKKHNSDVHRKPRRTEEECAAEKIFSCDLCDKPFDSRHRVLKHKKLQHEDDANKYKCQLCGETFKTNMLLLIHKNKHIPQKLTVVERRHKVLKHKQLQHEDDAKKYKCQLCEETFKNKLMLLIHKNKHISQKFTVVVKKKLPADTNS